jgi:hypothetical protein
MKTFKDFLNEEKSVGKKMGHDLYVHKDYAENHPDIPHEGLQKAKSHLPKDFDYTAVKYNKKEGSHSFIHSPDFDTADEPTVGKSIKVHASGETKVNNPPKDPLIWHGKHQWVKDDHKGFDVEKSKERHKHWKSVLGVNKDVSSRIGRKSYWDKWTKENL